MRLHSISGKSRAAGSAFFSPVVIWFPGGLRYEREVNRSERSCLKKILEQDDSASRPMVLCVAALRDSQGQDSGISGPMLELTDGWYWVSG